jgi:hypothetical protein
MGFYPETVVSHDKFMFCTAKDIKAKGLRLSQAVIPMLLRRGSELPKSS